jgi:L-fuconolactonase
MIIDAHCHAWNTWPYRPAVPDPHSRGAVEQLLHEMDQNGVDQALVVCAQLDHNPENNAYVAEQVQRFPDRLHQLVDLDSEWSPTYHQPGAARRLQQMAHRWPVIGFTHYLSRDDDGSWLLSEEGQAVFTIAASNKLLASLSCLPHQQPAIRVLAERFPTVPILCHHLGFTGLGQPENLAQVMASARLPNIYLKVSGFAYAAPVKWEYPYAEVLPIVRALYEAFGARHMCWGSDYPVVRYYMTYRQSLEVFRTHCTFISAEDQAWILGRTLNALLIDVRQELYG